MHDIARYLRTLMLYGSDEGEAIKHVQRFYGPTSAATKMVQRAFQKGFAISTSSINADADLANAFNEILTLIAEKSLIGKIGSVSPFRRLPTNTPILLQTEEPVAQWTRERGMTPAASTAFDQASIPPRKINSLLCATREMLALTGIAADRSLEQYFATGVAKVESRSFIDPDNAGIGEEEPSSITFGIAPRSATIYGIRSDLTQMIRDFSGDLDRAVFVMHPATGAAIGGAFNDLCGARGGEALGIPVITSSAVPNINSDGELIALIDPAQILLLDEGIRFSQSTSASILVEDSNGDGEHLFSLFQNDVVGIMATRNLNWMRARDSAVSTLVGDWVVDPA